MEYIISLFWTNKLFVDVIHTFSGSVGVWEANGVIYFYTNAGVKQTGIQEESYNADVFGLIWLLIKAVVCMCHGNVIHTVGNPLIMLLSKIN